MPVALPRKCRLVQGVLRVIRVYFPLILSEGFKTQVVLYHLNRLHCRANG